MRTYNISEAAIHIYSLKQKPSVVNVTPPPKNRRLAFTPVVTQLQRLRFCRNCRGALKAGLLGFSPLVLLNFCLVLPPGGSTGRGSIGFTKAHLYSVTPNYTAFLIELFVKKNAYNDIGRISLNTKGNTVLLLFNKRLCVD